MSNLTELILPAWETNARVTAQLVRALPAAVLRLPIPGLPRRTPGSIGVHLHDCRCRWIRTLGEPFGIPAPPLLGAAWKGKGELLRALRVSGRSMASLLALGCEHDGGIPATSRYVWRNLALDVGHVLTYFVAHEAHHRGQLLLAARQLGHPVPKTASDDLWWWKPIPSTRRSRKR